MLPSVAARLLPTPTVSDRHGPGHSGTGGLDLRSAVCLLPTPRAWDWKGCDPNPRGVDLNEALRRTTSTGASTPPPSDAGNGSSDAPLPFPEWPDPEVG
jgi:hypothetical protein